MLSLEDLAKRVIAGGFPYSVTASHCVSLGMHDESRQRDVAALVAEAGIHVVALPQTNLFLQGRGSQQAMPRGLTAVKALRSAGVNVAAGADNLQDPFNPVGRADALETAGLMITAGHLLPDEALATVTSAARAALGIPGLHDFVAVRATSVREAIAFGPADRIVIRNGAVVAR
jgi:cytosine deaminase